MNAQHDLWPDPFDRDIRPFRDEKAQFNAWMKKVDREVLRRVGASVYDLADQPYWDWWAAGYSPEDAANEALYSEGFIIGLEWDGDDLC